MLQVLKHEEKYSFSRFWVRDPGAVPASSFFFILCASRLQLSFAHLNHTLFRGCLQLSLLTKKSFRFYEICQTAAGYFTFFLYDLPKKWVFYVMKPSVFKENYVAVRTSVPNCFYRNIVATV